jgi:membrane associated rhomboid family serine protease
MAYYRSGFWANIPPVVKNIIIINVIMLLITLLWRGFMMDHFALFYPNSPEFKPYQLLSHMFMHGGYLHLLFNMYALWLFGNHLERQMGSRKFLLYYLVTGIGASLFYLLVLWLQVHFIEARIDPGTLAEMNRYLHEGMALKAQTKDMVQWYTIMYTPMVGASGAVYGVLLAFGMLFPNLQLQLMFPPVTLKAKWFVVIYGAIELVLALSQPNSNIAHFAHIGGMLFGFLLIRYWMKRNRTIYY